jgi:hypothetical protein
MKLLPVLAGLIAALTGCAGVSTERARLEALYVEVSSDAAMARLACSVQAGKVPGRKWSDCPSDGWPTLSINRNPSAIPAIAQLTAIRMDASLGEARACVTLQRGKEVLPHLRSLNTATARTTCETQWQRVKADNDPPRYPDVSADDVCNNEQDIKRVRDRYIKQIEAGEQCWPWMFD